MSRTIQLHDREDYKRAMRDLLTIDPAKTVALTIDMQRDFLDPSVATAPVAADIAERVVADTAGMLRLCRESGIGGTAGRLVAEPHRARTHRGRPGGRVRQ